MSLEEIRQVRIEKLKKIQNAGQNPYPARTLRTHTILNARKSFTALSAKKENIILVGRVMTFREHGGSTFANLFDGTALIQVYFKKDLIGDDRYRHLLETVDIGDFLEVSGFLFTTKKGEETLQIKSYSPLAKTLLPLPEKWHGLRDVEERFRKRYLDILFNPEVRKKLTHRSEIIQHVRSIFVEEGFLEVETPILQTIPGGATARPFKTHLSTLDLDLYLRVAPELYLKRLLVGGINKVFEMGRNFRNEGIDREHNPEFSMLEAYATYQDYEWLMSFFENFFKKLVSRLNHSEKNLNISYQGKDISFQAPFERIPFAQLLRDRVAIDYDTASKEELYRKAQELKIIIDKNTTKEILADEIYKKAIRPEVIQPTFIINHPVEISPLSKKRENDSRHVERLQLLVGGLEMVNAFSELNDPLDQRARFEEQEEKRAGGDKEAHRVDEEFLEALEYGMPPAAGLGLGIDRLVMLLTDSKNLREILWFPLMKPKL